MIRLNEDKIEYNVGPFKSLEVEINYLEDKDEQNKDKEIDKRI